MSTKIYQRCKPIAVGVNATVEFDGYGIDGFLPYTTGTVTLTTSLGLVVLNAFPVTAGVPVPLPIGWTDSAEGGIFTAAGGASGVLLI
jgi:hypothetical protein